MRRRDFMVATGSTILTGSAVRGFQRPAVGVKFEVSATPDVDPNSVRSLLVSFDRLEITPSYIDDGEDLSIQTKLAIEDSSKQDSVESNNIGFTSGKTLTLSEIESRGGSSVSELVVNGISESSNIRGKVTVKVDHANISSQSYIREFSIQGDSIPSSTLTENLNAWYRFEDGDARDYATTNEYPNKNWGDSTAYDGTVNGAIYNSTSGVKDFKSGNNSGAYEFNGSESIEFSDDSISGEDSFTMMAWTYARSINSGYPGIVVSETNGSPSQTGIFLRNSTSNYYFEIDVNDNPSFDNVSVKLDQWVHLAYTYDGSTVEEYIDGQPTGNSLSTDGGSVPSEDILRVGEWSGGPSYFDGFIDDVRIYNRDLTDGEILNIYDFTQP